MLAGENKEKFDAEHWAIHVVLEHPERLHRSVARGFLRFRMMRPRDGQLFREDTSRRVKWIANIANVSPGSGIRATLSCFIQVTFNSHSPIPIHISCMIPC